MTTLIAILLVIFIVMVIVIIVLNIVVVMIINTPAAVPKLLSASSDFGPHFRHLEALLLQRPRLSLSAWAHDAPNCCNPHTYMHTCIHAYMHTHIHAYIQRQTDNAEQSTPEQNRTEQNRTEQNRQTDMHTYKIHTCVRTLLHMYG